MSVRWGWVLLSVSLMFNVLFGIGYVKAQLGDEKHQTFEERAQWMVERLQLDQNQQEVFDALLEDTISKRSGLMEKSHARKERLLEELLKEHPDEAVIQEFLNQDAFKERRELMIGHIRKMMAVLRPEQKEAFAEMMRKRWIKRSR